MTKTELLKDLMRFQVSRYNYRIVGHSLYFILPNNNFAVAKLLNTNKPNDYNGIVITCVNVPFGEINSCELLFSDIFYDESTTTIIKMDDGSYGWYKNPTVLDKLNLSDHIGKYFEIISYIDKTSMFASSGMPFLGLGAAAIQSASKAMVIDVKEGVLPQKMTQEEEFSEEYEPIGELVEEESSEEGNADETAIEDITDDTNTADVVDVVDSAGIVDSADVVDDVDIVVTTDNVDSADITDDSMATDDPIIEKSFDEILSEDTEPAIPEKKKRLFGNWFRKKDPAPEKHPKKQRIEQETLSELKEAVKDDEIPEEKIFKSWDVSGPYSKDVKAALKKTQEEDYELRIIGKGDMVDLNLIPWEEYAFNIHKIIVYEGVTSIGANAFKSLKYAETVEIADSVMKIGASAFEYCESLTDIKLPENLEEIGDFAFAGCDGIAKYILPDTVRKIGDYAFDFDRLSQLTVYSKNPEGVALGDGIDPARFLIKKSNL